MSDYDNDPGRPRPEVVNETVVVVDGRAGGGQGLGPRAGRRHRRRRLRHPRPRQHLGQRAPGGDLRRPLPAVRRHPAVLRRRRERKTGRIIAGVIAIVAGVALIAWPEASVKTVAVIVGLAFLIWGIAVAVAAIASRGEGYGVVVGFGFILAIVGLIFIIWPGPTVTLLMILVGLSALLFGISAIVQALALRRALHGA